MAYSPKLYGWLREQSKDQQGIPKNTWYGLLKHFYEFAGRGPLPSEVDQAFCERFRQYLTEKATSSYGHLLSTNTQISYIAKFQKAMKAAERHGLVQSNPAATMALPRQEAPRMTFLWQEELRQLSHTPCSDPVTRAAFLFSCGSGLRFSNIQNLRWQDLIYTEDGRTFIYNTEPGVGELVYQPLGAMALSMLPEQPGNNDELIFANLKSNSTTNKKLKEWASDAGLEKVITFQAGRRTFAVNFLANSGSLYTLSRLLGHASLKATAKYAELENTTEKDSVNYFPGIT